MCNWSEMNQNINEAQAGLRNGYCTTHNMFTHHALIQKYLSKKKGRLHVLSIDFEKAFDKICHNLYPLLEKNGRFLACLMKIYTKNKSCAKVDDSYTSCFLCLKGTKQGG